MKGSTQSTQSQATLEAISPAQYWILCRLLMPAMQLPFFPPPHLLHSYLFSKPYLQRVLQVLLFHVVYVVCVAMHGFLALALKHIELLKQIWPCNRWPLERLFQRFLPESLLSLQDEWDHHKRWQSEPGREDWRSHTYHTVQWCNDCNDVWWILMNFGKMTDIKYIKICMLCELRLSYFSSKIRNKIS